MHGNGEWKKNCYRQSSASKCSLLGAAGPPDQSCHKCWADWKKKKIMSHLAKVEDKITRNQLLICFVRNLLQDTNWLVSSKGKYQGKKLQGGFGRFHPRNALKKKKRALKNKKKAPKNCHRLQCKNIHMFNVADLVNGM